LPALDAARKGPLRHHQRENFVLRRPALFERAQRGRRRPHGGGLRTSLCWNCFDKQRFTVIIGGRRRAKAGETGFGLGRARRPPGGTGFLPRPLGYLCFLHFVALCTRRFPPAVISATAC